MADEEGVDEARAALEQRCLELGLTADQIRDAGDELLAVAIRHVLPTRRELTFAEVAARAGVPSSRVAALARAMHLRDGEIDEPLFDDRDVAALRRLGTADEMLGPEAVAQLVRVAATAAARVGDAAISTFFTGAGAKAALADPSGRALLDANAAASAMLPAFGDLLSGMLVRHIQRSYREMTDEQIDAAAGGLDTQVQSIGFADLVDSTVLADRASLDDLNAALDAFERTAEDTVETRSGRVVKFIGDEVMFRADDATAACLIALDLVDLVRHDDQLPPLRVGVAHGRVLTREGDYHGPTVNLAARVTKLAPPDGVVVTAATAEALDHDVGFTVEALGAIGMRGFAEPVELVALSR